MLKGDVMTIRKINTKKSKKTVAEKIIWTAIFIFLIIYTILFLSLLLWGINTSFKSYTDFSLLENYIGLPSSEFSKKEIAFGNYKVAIKELSYNIRKTFYSNGTLIVNSENITFGKTLFNTIIYAGGGAVLLAFVPMLMGYCCSQYKFVVSKIINTIVIFAMIMPTIGSESSLLSLLMSLNLYDKLYGTLILNASFTGMYFLVFQAFFDGLSGAYVEAAEIDGASQTMIFFRIMIPLAIKVFGTVVLLHFIGLWNNYQTPMVLIPTHPTFAYTVYHLGFKGTGVFKTVPVQLALVLVLTMPILVLFLFFRDKIMGGVAIGGVKE